MAEQVKVEFIADTAKLEQSLKESVERIKQDLSKSVEEATTPKQPADSVKGFKERLKEEVAKAGKEAGAAGGQTIAQAMAGQASAGAAQIAADFQAKLQGAFILLGSALAVPLGLKFALTGSLALVEALKPLVEKTDEASRKWIEFASAGKLAGLTIDQISNSAAIAAQSFQLTTNQSIAFTKSLIALREAAGSSQDVGRIGDAVGNLAAVKGFKGENLNALVEQLSQGVGSAFEAVGIVDLNARYEQYARSIRVSVEYLTEQEKAQIRLNALMEAGNQLTGAAAAANETLAGVYGRLSKAETEVKDNLSELVNFSPLLRELTITLAQFFETAGAFNKDRIIAELKSGKSSLDIARENTEGVLPGGLRITDLVRSLITLPFAPAALGLGGLGAVNEALNPFAIKDRDVESARQMVDAYKQLLEASEKQAETEKKAREERDKATIAERERIQQLKAFQQDISRQMREPVGVTGAEVAGLKRFLPDGLFNVTPTGKSPFASLENIPTNLATSLETLRNIREQVATSPLFKEPERLQQLFDIDRTIEQSINTAKQRIDTIVQSARAATIDIFAQVNTQNPFVRVYSDAERAIERTRDATRGLTDDIRQQLLATTRAGEAFKLFTARVDARQESLTLRQQAEDFRRPLDANAIRQAEQRYLERYLAANPNFLFLNNLTSLDVNSPIAQQILNRARDAGILDDPTARTRRRIDQQINLLRSVGATNQREAELIDTRLIGLSRGIDPNTLRADQRAVIADALERQAERVERREQEAISIMQEQLAVQKAISQAQRELLQVAQQQGQRGVEAIIRLQNETDNTARASLKAPSAQDTARVFAGEIGLLSTSSGLTNR